MKDKLVSLNYDTGRIEEAPNCNNITCVPPKCLCKRVEVPTFVYWNPGGVAISNDTLIRTLCYNPHKAMDGTDIFLNMKNMKNIQLYVYDRM